MLEKPEDSMLAILTKFFKKSRRNPPQCQMLIPEIVLYKVETGRPRSERGGHRSMMSIATIAYRSKGRSGHTRSCSRYRLKSGKLPNARNDAGRSPGFASGRLDVVGASDFDWEPLCCAHSDFLARFLATDPDVVFPLTRIPPIWPIPSARL